MTFDEAEAKFRERRAHRKPGVSLSQAEFEAAVNELALRDDRGTWWTIHPETGAWMYYNGTQWIDGIPPRHMSSLARPASIAESTQRSAAGPSPSLRADAIPNVSEQHYARSLRGQQLRTDILPRDQEDKRGYAWLPLAIGIFVMLFCSLTAWVLRRPVWQALTQPPVFATTPLLALPTVSPLPTYPRWPTPLVPAGPAESVMARVIEVRVNVRAAPNLQAQVLTTLPRDERITLIGQSADGQWYQVTYRLGTKPAWVFGETLEIVDGSVSTLPVVTP